MTYDKIYQTANLSTVEGKNIAFVLYNYTLGVSTMLINSIALLSTKNNVDVFINDADRRDQPCDQWLDNHFITYPNFSRILVIRIARHLIRKLTALLNLKSSRFTWAMSNLDLYMFSIWLKYKNIRRRYEIIMPVECYALIAVHKARNEGQDIVYFNMELLDWSEDNPLHSDKAILKQKEIDALESVAHVMITSPERGKLFSSMNRFPAERISSLPVLSLRESDLTRSDFFRKKFNIPDGKLVVIYSGNFQPWAQCVEIISSMSTWPENAVLVMHTWNKASLGTDYFREMTSSAVGRPVIFSTEYILYKDLSKALSSADIGLLFYEGIDANFTEILFSSNKMSEYMSANLPVICTPFPTLQEFVLKEQIGIACDFSEVGSAISQIAADLENYRIRVAHCRKTHFEFEPYFYRAFSSYAKNRNCYSSNNRRN